MADRNLPIKFFQKRQKDQLDTEGGGGGNPPAWVNPRQALTSAKHVRQVLGDLTETIEKKIKRNNFIPTVVRLKVNPNALAKTYRREIGNFFNLGKINMIGLDGDDELLIKFDNLDDLKRTIGKFQVSSTDLLSDGRLAGLSAFSSLEKFKPLVDIKADKKQIAKIKLFNFGDANLNKILIAAFEDFCVQHNLDIKKADYSQNTITYRASGISKDALSELEDFDGIELITRMPTFDLISDEATDEETVEVKAPENGLEYPVVGILDSGIADIPQLAPWIDQNRFSKYHQDDIDKAHGTFVAGVLLYGDDLENSNYTGFKGCMLHEAIVIPDKNKQKIYEDELIENIRDAINNRPDIKIWNLSLGITREAGLYDFSDFANMLDEIQDINDILICKSVGNCENFKHRGPKSRIAVSADTVRGLVVGSLGHDRKIGFMPSIFSRIGPGPSRLIKPDLVHVGGNASLDTRNRVINEGVKSFKTDGTGTSRTGTSFSTPRISSIAAGLSTMLSEPFDPLLLKAMIIHSARYPLDSTLDLATKINEMGFGMPGKIDAILFNEPNEITLVLQDTIEKRTYIDILDFPFPQSMIDEDGFYFGELTVTLVTSPVLYCRNCRHEKQNRSKTLSLSYQKIY